MQEKNDLDDCMAIVIRLRKRITELLYGDVVLFIKLLCLCYRYFALFFIRNL